MPREASTVVAIGRRAVKNGLQKRSGERSRPTRGSAAVHRAGRRRHYLARLRETKANRELLRGRAPAGAMRAPTAASSPTRVPFVAFVSVSALAALSSPCSVGGTGRHGCHEDAALAKEGPPPSGPRPRSRTLTELGLKPANRAWLAVNHGSEVDVARRDDLPPEPGSPTISVPILDLHVPRRRESPKSPSIMTRFLAHGGVWSATEKVPRQGTTSSASNRYRQVEAVIPPAGVELVQVDAAAPSGR
jgi:hypothetical protein